ncbi:DUF1127 domain-containing protein [Pelagibius marinus]|uniref:DUF1127 domain-containing protein n=1 Tax=Pelagibius marinus TaxID=2762760 RepID=UPI001872A345|nr:DUF1127 domain-containing protein [Pelagibius marinus]
MIRLSEFPGNPAGSGAVRWDQRSVDALSVIQTARTLRAEYIADHLHSAAESFGRWTGLSALVAAWRRRRQSRRTLKALTALDDHVLSDIGVNRAEIAATAALSCDKSPRGENSVWHGLGAWAEREVHRRRTLRELSRLSDEMLADIGISRAEIPAVVADLFAGRTRTAAGETIDISTDIPVTAPVPAQVLAFVEVRRSLQRAANQNLDRPAA